MLFEIEKELKHSRRYRAVDDDFPVQTVYVRRPFADNNENLNIAIEGFQEEGEK